MGCTVEGIVLSLDLHSYSLCFLFNLYYILLLLSSGSRQPTPNFNRQSTSDYIYVHDWKAGQLVQLVVRSEDGHAIGRCLVSRPWEEKKGMCSQPRLCSRR